MEPMVVLFVADQEKAKDFYQALLAKEPLMHVEGMTEFKLNDHCMLGLMPRKLIHQILDKPLPLEAIDPRIPLAELYLKGVDVALMTKRALDHGGLLLSEPRQRNWGDLVAYVMDQDGHVIAFSS